MNKTEDSNFRETNIYSQENDAEPGPYKRTPTQNYPNSQSQKNTLNSKPDFEKWKIKINQILLIKS